MDMQKRQIQLNQRLADDYKYVRSLGHNVLGVFVQGSDNYLLSWDGSDIDTKAIILPSFEDFCLNKKPVSTTLILPSNEHSAFLFSNTIPAMQLTAAKLL